VACFVFLRLTYAVLDGVWHIFVLYFSQSCSHDCLPRFQRIGRRFPEPFVDPKLLQPMSWMPTMRPMKLSHPTNWLLFCRKLEVATAGTEAVLHHWELLLIGNHLRISGNPVSGLYLTTKFIFCRHNNC